MPKDPSIRSVLVIGSGPIVIGQACEFDYSGTQAIKVLRREGIRVSLVNSNPATIMTDPEYADRTYIEPLTPETVEAILEREPPGGRGGRGPQALQGSHGPHRPRGAAERRRPQRRRGAGGGGDDRAPRGH